MRGRLASRAHSFKENLLGAFGHHASSSEAQSPSSLVHGGEGNKGYENTPPNKKENNYHYSKRKSASHEQPPSTHIRALAKKTNSSDNLIEYSAPKCTDSLVREVQLALRYFEDAVAKGTYEMLPGCATVVLETVVAMQSFAVSKASQALQAVIAKENEAANNGLTLRPPPAFENQTSNRLNQDRFGIFKAMENVYSCVAKLTQWADRLIVEGHIDKEDDYISKIIDPLRKSVIVLANAISNSDELSKKTTQVLRRSLPDVLAAEEYEVENQRKNATERKHSCVKPPSPPPKPSMKPSNKKAPPLPPKGTSNRHTVSFSEDDVDSSDPFSGDNVGSEGAKHLDWFSNPLFGQEPLDQNKIRADNHPDFDKKDRKKGKKKASVAINKNKQEDLKQKADEKIQLSAVDVPDFCRPQRNSVHGLNEFVLNSSDDLQSSGFDKVVSFNDALRNDSNVRPLAASSPKPNQGGSTKRGPLAIVNPSSLNVRNRDSSSSSGGDIPPALPLKANMHGPSSQSELKKDVRRKISQYDNVFASPPPAMFLSPPPGVKNQKIIPPEHMLRPLEATSSLFPNFRPEFSLNPDQRQLIDPTSGFRNTFSQNELADSQHSPLRAYSSEPPPPLPPKKRNIMSYMEMFGQSVLPTGILFPDILHSGIMRRIYI